MEIKNFSGEYEFLSNFYSIPVRYEYFYGSSEAAYQAQKAANLADRLEFRNYSPQRAKRRARKIPIRADWNEIKIACMRDIVYAKFLQNAELAAKLLATGDNLLVEGNYWHDTFWGVDDSTGVGENNLGKILMEVRANLKNLDVEILSGDVTLTRFTLPEKTAYNNLQFAQKFEIEQKIFGDVKTCRYRIRGREFFGFRESRIFRDGDDIIFVSGQGGADISKISIYIGLKNFVAQIEKFLD